MFGRQLIRIAHAKFRDMPAIHDRLERLIAVELTENAMKGAPTAAGDSPAILLHPPLHSVVVSIRTQRGCQQNDKTLVNG